LLGNFYRDGKLYATAAITVNDHDFKSFAKGVVIPHGLYDVQLNKAMINIGSSCDTGEFACDSLRQWWYSKANRIIRTPTPFYYYVMAVAAMVATSIFSKRTYNN